MHLLNWLVSLFYPSRTPPSGWRIGRLGDRVVMLSPNNRKAWCWDHHSTNSVYERAERAMTIECIWERTTP